MELGNSVRSILLRYINNQKKQDNNYFIAQIILDSFNTIPQLTIYELSEKCFVSTAAISRFIRLLGFATYTEFKAACEAEIGIVHDYDKKYTMKANEPSSDFMEEFTENLYSNLAYCQQHLSESKLQEVVQMIAETPDVVVFGLEFAAFMSQHFQSRLAMMDKRIHTGFTVADQLETIEKIQPNSLALIFSMEGGFFYFNEKVVAALKKKNARIIVFTFKNSPMIERSADEVIICGERNENTEGRLSVLYVMELLIFYYMRTIYLP
ncbi:MULTISPECIES: MurR/RpiR family transcriptional regulator [Enterococcus]|uniref:MurR/RpiR family transcriptional regulator n=1 Tax=Enterococcus TaxID=1350 RepID=UPI000ECB7645|nr:MULTISPECIES: MurR/RpiR family transcriptional regulator [Enterococcus]HCM84711.1 MurR/RpiR family transcriptional regulator [Enterococcus sp.]